MNNTETESQVQIKVVHYLDILMRQWKVLWFTGSGNWQFQKSIWVKMKMKAEWIRAGMPDLMIVLPTKLVFIELKREKWGKPTEEQLHAIEMINKMWDTNWYVQAYMCYGFEETKLLIDLIIK